MNINPKRDAITTLDGSKGTVEQFRNLLIEISLCFLSLSLSLSLSNPRQRRGQGGVACLIKKEIEKYVSIIKNDEHKCYIWLEIETPNDLLTFVVGCYIPHQDSNFYDCLDKNQPFANLEDDIA